MASVKWNTVDINTKDGVVKGIAPVIVSASWATDIPAFYPEWFINRLRQGYTKWINPFNGKPQYVSFDKTRVIVFWTEDAEPMIPSLKEIDDRGINYYFLFTVNDYEKEGLEPKVRKLSKRIDTFRRLSERIGKDRVIWRFDPLILTDKITVDVLLDKVYGVGNQNADYTNKLVISFADISSYRKVKNNLNKYGVKYKEFEAESMEEVAKGLDEINRSWGMEIATCAEDIDLSGYNIKRNKCIDDDLMRKVFSRDKELMNFLGYDNDRVVSDHEEITLFDSIDDKERKIPCRSTNNSNYKSGKLADKGQRKSCGCIISKDIGQYDTCAHQCLYCYANSSPRIAASNHYKYLKSGRNGESILE